MYYYKMFTVLSCLNMFRSAVLMEVSLRYIVKLQVCFKEGCKTVV